MILFIIYLSTYSEKGHITGFDSGEMIPKMEVILIFLVLWYFNSQWFGKWTKCQQEVNNSIGSNNNDEYNVLSIN